MGTRGAARYLCLENTQPPTPSRLVKKIARIFRVISVPTFPCLFHPPEIAPQLFKPFCLFVFFINFFAITILRSWDESLQRNDLLIVSFFDR